ncbi:amidohydrolase [Rhodococcus sp. PvR044]|uniref:M20 family metallopeptidase n=1 Tax=Rhodococcus sp. PvR044 TaxID=3156402 RepID=UPI002F96B29E
MDLKEAVRQNIGRAEQSAVDLSHRIHAHPEVGFEEYRAAQWVGDALSEAGFAVNTGVADLPTALLATAGDGPLVVGICAEYDALPGLGHACGHNVIAGSAVAAARALAPLASDLGITVKVFGTPAEENGGGKILMLDAGVFDGTHAAMMVHPATFEQAYTSVLANGDLLVDFTGKNAHASAAPYEGVNAGDAVTLAQVAIGLLRQQLHPGDQIHGIVTNGGEAPNIIPAKAGAHYYIRASDLESLKVLEQRVQRCFEAAALATGCEMTSAPTGPDYSEFRNNTALADLYETNARQLGRRFAPVGETSSALGSTDMGNVSRAIPAIHPTLALDCGTSVNHQPEFAAHCAGASADRALIDGATAMAWTIVDLATDPTLRARFIAGN